MGKTVLTLDEINLLKNSEELKDTNLYGNLYDCILKLQNPKATSLESIPNLDDLGRAALTINKKTLIDNVIKEWYAEKVSEEDPNKKVHCDCVIRQINIYIISEIERIKHYLMSVLVAFLNFLDLKVILRRNSSSMKFLKDIKLSTEEMNFMLNFLVLKIQSLNLKNIFQHCQFYFRINYTVIYRVRLRK